MKERNLIAERENNMKKFLKLLLFITILVIGVRCKPATNPDNPSEEEPSSIEIDELTIYSINDFHGALLEDGIRAGISKIGNFLITEKQNNPNSTLIISAGDMFQGTALSSMTRGRAVVDAMNAIGFDAMTLGNHEFDWGVDQIKVFHDDDLTNGEAEFEFLAANVCYKGTNQLAEWATPYIVINKGGLKVGIIGVLGTDQTNDILASYVADYDFTDELTAIKKYAKALRTEEDCDIVIVSAHLDTSSISRQLSSLSGDEKIDALLNGHTHQQYYGEYTYGREVALPYVQSGSSGQYLGKITLEIDKETGSVIDVSSENLATISTCQSESLEINNILGSYQSYLDIAQSVLGVAGETIYKNTAGIWMATTIKERFSTDVAVVNAGGVRSSAFPIYIGDDVTYGDIFEIMPFENMICTSQIAGSDLLNILKYMNDGMYFSNNVTQSGGIYYIDGVAVVNSKLYTVGTIDYLFEKEYYPFKDGENTVFTTILLREIMVESVYDKIQSYSKFYVTK